MASIFQRILRATDRNRRRLPDTLTQSQRTQLSLKQTGIEAMYIVLGVFSATFGLEGFLIPNAFIDGGVMGISLLVNEVTKIDLPLLIFSLNLPFLVMGYISIGRRFAFKSVLAISLLSLAIYAVPIPLITENPLLAVLFGGVFLGMGIGLAIRGGAIIDGTEVLAVFVSRRTSLTVGNVILLFNLGIFSVAAYLLGTEIALYAILTYFAASRTVDFVIDGIEEYIGVTVISPQNDAIRRMITEKLSRGVTVYKGQKGYYPDGDTGQPIDIVFTVISRLELSRLTREIDRIDLKAFVVMHAVKDTRGGVIRKKPIKNIK